MRLKRTDPSSVWVSVIFLTNLATRNSFKQISKRSLVVWFDVELVETLRVKEKTSIFESSSLILICVIKRWKQSTDSWTGSAVKWPPMDEMTWNLACRGALWGTIELWSSWGHTASMEARPIFLISGTFWVSNMHTQHPSKLVSKTSYKSSNHT